MLTGVEYRRPVPASASRPSVRSPVFFDISTNTVVHNSTLTAVAATDAAPRTRKGDGKHDRDDPHNHQDHADGVNIEARRCRGHGEVQDRADRDQNNSRSQSIPIPSASRTKWRVNTDAALLRPHRATHYPNATSRKPGPRLLWKLPISNPAPARPRYAEPAAASGVDADHCRLPRRETGRLLAALLSTSAIRRRL